MAKPIPTIFSKGWLFLFLAVLVISILRVIQKLRVIHREGAADAKVRIVKPIRVERGPSEAADPGSEQEKGVSGLRNREQGLTAELERYPVEESPAERARVLCDLGVVYRELSRIENREEELLKAAQCYYQASGIFSPQEAPEEHGGLMVHLADIYVELSGTYKKAECLRRAGAAYARALNVLGSESHPDRRAGIGAKLGRVLVELADESEPGKNLLRAIQVLSDTVTGYPDDETSPGRALAMHDLGRAYLKYAALAEPQQNLIRAGKAFKESLKTLTRESYPEHHEAVRISVRELREAYGRLVEREE